MSYGQELYFAEAKAIVMYPNCTVEILEDFACGGWKSLLVLESPKCPATIMKTIIKQQTGDNNTVAKLKAAAHPNCDEQLLLEMAGWDRDTVMTALNNPNCSSKILTKALNRQYSKDSDRDAVYMILATHPLINSFQLAQLAQVDNVYIRSAVADNPNTPNEILVDLAQSNDPEVLQAVISNPNAAHDVIMLAHAHQ